MHSNAAHHQPTIASPIVVTLVIQHEVVCSILCTSTIFASMCLKWARIGGWRTSSAQVAHWARISAWRTSSAQAVQTRAICKTYQVGRAISTISFITILSIQIVKAYYDWTEAYCDGEPTESIRALLLGIDMRCVASKKSMGCEADPFDRW